MVDRQCILIKPPSLEIEVICRKLIGEQEKVTMYHYQGVVCVLAAFIHSLLPSLSSFFFLLRSSGTDRQIYSSFVKHMITKFVLLFPRRGRMQTSSWFPSVDQRKFFTNTYFCLLYLARYTSLRCRESLNTIGSLKFSFHENGETWNRS